MGIYFFAYVTSIIFDYMKYEQNISTLASLEEKRK